MQANMCLYQQPQQSLGVQTLLTEHWDREENMFSSPAHWTWFHGTFHGLHPCCSCKDSRKIYSEWFSGSLPFPGGFYADQQIFTLLQSTTWSWWGSSRDGGEGTNSPSTERGEKQIREMGVQGTVEALWYKTKMIKMIEAVITRWKCQVWVLWSCSRSWFCIT